MSFLRRISNAAQSILPSLPNSQGIPAAHVPRRATETFTKPIGGGKHTFLEEESSGEEDRPRSRASWELSDSESGEGSSRASSRSDKSDDSEDEWSSDASSDSEVDVKGRQKDRFDMMARHLWSVGDRQGWFRDAEYDGIVSLR
jgi:hypothetical protein